MVDGVNGTSDADMVVRRYQSLPREENMGKLLKDPFIDTLKDVYFAEQKIVGTLPVME
jgi:hypothetical protein